MYWAKSYMSIRKGLNVYTFLRIRIYVQLCMNIGVEKPEPTSNRR